MTARQFQRGKNRSMPKDGISHKLSQFYPMKAVMVSLLGCRFYMNLQPITGQL